MKLKPDKLRNRTDSVQIYAMLLPKLPEINMMLERTFNEIYAINLISSQKINVAFVRSAIKLFNQHVCCSFSGRYINYEIKFRCISSLDLNETVQNVST